MVKKVCNVESHTVVLQAEKVIVISTVCVIEKKNLRLMADISTDVLYVLPQKIFSISLKVRQQPKNTFKPF